MCRAYQDLCVPPEAANLMVLRVAIRRLFEAFPALAYQADQSLAPAGHEFRKVGRVIVTLR